MKVIDMICSPGRTGFFFDDQKSIKTNAKLDGNTYEGIPITPGFNSVRQAGESISVIFIMEDGEFAYGDCAAVQYSGAGGRDPLFLAKEFIALIVKEIKPLIVGKEFDNFRNLAGILDGYRTIDGKRLHTAIRYGITQAALDYIAKSEKKLMAQVVANEYEQKVSDKIIPIFTQSGDDRYNNTDKMIMKCADVLPHGLINNVKDKLGENGDKLLDYVIWLRERVIKLRMSGDYKPILHIDVYGTLGTAFRDDNIKIVDYLCRLEEVANPFRLRIEGPVDVGNREKQIEALRDIREKLDSKGIKIEIVADEWCNTFEDVVDFTNAKAGHMVQIKTPDLGGINNSIEAILYCKDHGIGAYLGGTCNETDRSAQICAHIAMATSPDQTLAKPGMGVDEGFMIMYNEMQRILVLKDVL